MHVSHVITPSIQAKATTIKEAITKWEEKAQAPVTSASTIKLLCQLPPIEKMDAALSQISHVEYVDLCLCV
jgi:dynein light chain 1